MKYLCLISSLIVNVRKHTETLKTSRAVKSLFYVAKTKGSYSKNEIIPWPVWLIWSIVL